MTPMERSTFDRAVNDQQWLFELPHRLNIAIVVLDTQLAEVFSAGSSPAVTAIRQLVTPLEQSLVSVMPDVLRSGPPIQVAIDGLQMLCGSLSQVGVLILGREVGSTHSAPECCQELELIGSWISSAIEATLTKPFNGVNTETYRIASIQRALKETLSRGSAR